MADKPGFLRNLRIKRVALVDSGANFDKATGDGAHIMMWKRADPMAKNPGVGDVHVDSPDWDADDADDYEKADLSGDARRKLPDSAFAAVWTDAQGKKHRKLPIHDAGHLAAARGRIAQADIPADVKAAAQHRIDSATHKEKNVKKSFIQKLLGLVTETDVTKRTQLATEIEKEFPPDEDDKPIHKADDAMCKCADCVTKRSTAKSANEIALEKRQTDLEKANADLQKRLDTQIEKADKDEIRTVLKSFAKVAVDIEKDVDVFYAMRKADSASYDRTIAIMKASDAQLASSALYANVGSSRVGEGSAWAQIVAKAEAFITKSGTKMTKEQALDEVMQDPANLGLVKAYRAESASQQ